MKTNFIFIIAFISCHLGYSQQKNNCNHNLGFEDFSTQYIPKGWYFEHSNNYKVAVDTIEKHSGKAALLIESIGLLTDSLSSQWALYTIPLDHRGNEVMVKVYLKSEYVNSLGEIFVLVDGTRTTLKRERISVSGNRPWVQYQTNMSLPEEAKSLRIMAILNGGGKLWVDDIDIFIDGVNLAEEKRQSETEIPKIFPELEKPIKENTYNISSINPQDTNFSDLQPLKQLLKNRRVIMLGEANHSDGGAFLAKTRLIKFLHEEMGFNTLALECGNFFYMNPRTMDYKENTFKKMINTWSSVWYKNETMSLFHYIEQSYKTVNPLKPFGFDNTLYYNTNSYDFIDSLRQFCSVRNIHLVDDTYWAQIKSTVDSFYAQENYFSLPPEKRGNIHLLLAKQMDSLMFVFLKQTFPKTDKKDIEFYKLCVENAQLDLLSIKTYFESEEEFYKSVALRDKQMAKCLVWYLDSYPNEKIIIWAANLHISHDADKITSSYGDTNYYKKFRPMGDFLKKKYGDQVYSLGTMGLGGFSGFPGSLPSEIELGCGYDFVIPQNSFSFLVANTIKYKNFILNFESLRKNPSFKNAEFHDQLYGYVMHKGAWLNIFDGVLYLKDMVPQTSISKELYPKEHEELHRKYPEIE